MSDLKEVVTQVISGLDPTPRIHEHLSKHKHDRPLTVVGFGKAVYRMAVGMESSGLQISPESIISIPHEQKEIPCLSTIRVRKGARRNLPDEDSHIATKEILTCLSGMKEDSHCVILISGGGSACLCAPVEPMTLSEKRDIIHLLSIYGASIYEINTVRKRLSAIKGGKLLNFIPDHVPLVTVFVLSDVLGDPLDVIASGPTTPNKDHPNAAKCILQKYHVDPHPDVLDVWNEGNNGLDEVSFQNRIEHVWVGNLRMALDLTCVLLKKAFKCCVVRMSSVIEGEASFIGRMLGNIVTELILGSLCMPSELAPWIDDDECETDLYGIYEMLDNRAVCFIGGGETVVSMDLQNQTGSGGRNQELVLSFIQVMNQNKDLILNSSFRFEFMSCGTDGIDGPTDAGGALFSYRDLYEGNDIEVDSIEEALRTHDSYGYFSRLNGGRNHFKPGHTGTNVLDLHILKIWLEFPKKD